MSDESTAARKIYFFRIEHFSEYRSLLPGAFEKIENLPFSDQGRYMVIDAKTGARLCVFPDSLDYPIRLRFGRTRRNHLPEVEKSGKLEALDLDEEAGLIDLGHLIIFDDGHVAAEWNPEGPKLQRLSQYLIAKGDINGSIKFRNLFERDIVEVVRGLGAVRVLDIDLPPDAVELARQADESLATAIRSAEQMGATKKVGLTLTAESGSAKLSSMALKLAQIVQGSPHERRRFSVLRATGIDSASSLTRYVDILEDKLVFGEMFPKRDARSRALDSDEAYRLIHRSYLQMRPKLESAATSGEL
jgi:hypothetical protein